MTAKKKATYYICLLGIAMLSSCGNGEQSQNRQKVNKELKSREIKKVSNSDVTEKAYQMGNLIAASAQQALFFELSNAIQQKGIDHALTYCSQKAIPLTDSLSKVHNVSISRTSLKLRNPKNQPNDFEKEILEAYQYNQEHDLELKDHVQEIDNQQLLFTRPIIINNPTCLSCHGQSNVDFDEKHYQNIQSLYPKDQATGYLLGDFRGIWSIRFNKSDIINLL
jgi:hypothetical protein